MKDSKKNLVDTCRTKVMFLTHLVYFGLRLDLIIKDNIINTYHEVVYELASKHLSSQIFLISWTQWNSAAGPVDPSKLLSSAFSRVLLASYICSQCAFDFCLHSLQFFKEHLLYAKHDRLTISSSFNPSFIKCFIWTIIYYTLTIVGALQKLSPLHKHKKNWVQHQDFPVTNRKQRLGKAMQLGQSQIVGK